MQLSEILAPWEYDGNAPPTVILGSQLLYKGSSVRFELLHQGTEDARLAFRMGEDDGSWTSTERMELCAPLKEATRCVVSALDKEAYVRLFHVGSEREAVRVEPKGIGRWRGWRDLESPFSLGRRISKMKSSQTREWMEKLLAQPSSDLVFAREFSRCDGSERRRRIYDFANEEDSRLAEEELYNLCRQSLQSDRELWIGVARIGWWLRPSFGSRPQATWHVQARGAVVQLSKRLESWANVLDQVCLPRSITEHLCLREWLEMHSVSIKGQLNAPSAHEQIEAHLALREWARAHLPPDVRAEMEERGF